MREAASVLIVGAGIAGTSIAFQLARRGARGVVVLEREALPGAGSTSKANGGIRAQFTTEVNLAMSLLSMDVLDGLEEEIGDPPAYRKAGYLFVTGRPEKLAAMEAAAAFQKERGVAVSVLDAAGVRRKAPYVAGEALAGGTFGARDGFVDPGRLCAFFASGAAHGGVSFRYGHDVAGIDPAPSGGYSVTTTTGATFTAPVLVLAAGAWSARVAAFLGLDLPVEPVRRHLFITGPVGELPPVVPMTIDADSGVLVRREGDRVLVAYSNPDEPPGFVTALDPDFVERFAEPLERRFPAIAAAGIDFRRSWAGLYEVTPDHHAILGEVPGRPGLLLATGFSGHGVMHAPATGRLMAELILDGEASSADIGPLSLARFASGALIHETMVL